MEACYRRMTSSSVTSHRSDLPSFGPCRLQRNKCGEKKPATKDPDYIAVRLNGSMRSMRTGLARLILLYRCRSACIIPCRTTLPTGRSISIGNVRLKQERADGCRKTERITDRRQKGPANISTGQAASKKTCPWTGNQLAYASL